MNANVSCDVLKIILTKADDVVQGEKILPVPSVDEFVLRFGEDSNNVKIRPGGQVICTCRGYTAHKLCSHSIAAAHFNKFLRSERCNVNRLSKKNTATYS